MKLTIRKRAPYGALLVPCEPVYDIPEARPWIVALASVLYANKLEGLSANQCGLPYRAFLTDVRGDGIRIFINPQITITDYDQEEIVEHCSSYRAGTVRQRHAHVIIEAQNFSGEHFFLDTANLYLNPVRNKKAGWRLSAAIQHEMEHIDGLDVRVEPTLPRRETVVYPHELVTSAYRPH